jgi:hypothetical protein
MMRFRDWSERRGIHSGNRCRHWICYCTFSLNCNGALVFGRIFDLSCSMSWLFIEGVCMRLESLGILSSDALAAKRF